MERYLQSPLICIGAAFLLVVAAQADDPAPRPESAQQSELNEQEQAFVDLMQDSVLAGRFSIDGKEDDAARTDRYTIQGVSKVKDDNWLVHARIVYGQNDIVIPVPVKMLWAGDTPVLSVTDLTIPGLGEQFSTRLLFHDGRYAGTWGHGDVGGHMWGVVEKQKPAE